MVFEVSRVIRPTVVEVDLGLLAQNTRILRQEMGTQVGIMAVIKADAYGHGALPVARLLEGLGIRAFGVATVEEGVALRNASISSPILVMGAAFGSDHAAVLEHDLTPMVGDPADVDRFAAAVAAAGRPRFGLHIKVDTGMTRVGVPSRHFEAMVRRCAKYPSIRIDGLAGHFSCAEAEDRTTTDRERDIFLGCLDLARSLGADPPLVHVANSAAALRFPELRFDQVRLGISLYGVVPGSACPDLGLQPVLSWHTRINAVHDVAAGTSISYGGSYTTQRPSRIATIPVGYADGYPRSLSNVGQVLVAGVRVPVVGHVCMDLTMIDVTDVSQQTGGRPARIDDPVTLIGSQGEGLVHPSDVAGWAGTIPYEILTRISKRVPRLYPGSRAAEQGFLPGRVIADTGAL